jgi:hypothetical protein
MYGDELHLPKPGLSDPDEVEPLEDDDGVEDETTEEEDELAARAEAGEVCENCGEEFTESNGKLALCADCFAIAEDAGEKEHAPLSKFPVIAA